MTAESHTLFPLSDEIRSGVVEIVAVVVVVVAFKKMKITNE